MTSIPLAGDDRAAVELVVSRFMSLNESTTRKNLLSKFRSIELLDRLSSDQFLRPLNTEGDLAPSSLGVDASSNAEYTQAARRALEITLHVLQNLYHTRPERTRFQFHDLLAHARQIYGDVDPIALQRGLYFAQELKIFDGYGPETAQQAGKKIFDVSWFTISEKIVELDPSTAWENHVRNLQSTAQSRQASERTNTATHSPPQGATKADIQIDSVTGVRSRAQFDADVGKVLSDCSTAHSPCSLLFIDLDKFKSVNDNNVDHAKGDEVLRATGSVLAEICRGRGAEYRHGGDEFVALLPNHTLLEAEATAERIRESIEKAAAKVCSEGVTASIGVACFPETSPDEKQLVRDADSAMYEAKNAGGNRVSGSPSDKPNDARNPRGLSRPTKSDAAMIVESTDLWVSILQAYHPNYRLMIENPSDYDLAIESIYLLRGTLKLCPPTRPTNPEELTVRAHSKQQILSWTPTIGPTSTLRMKEPQLPPGTPIEIDIAVRAKMLDITKTFLHTVMVTVDYTVQSLTQFSP